MLLKLLPCKCAQASGPVCDWQLASEHTPGREGLSQTEPSQWLAAVSGALIPALLNPDVFSLDTSPGSCPCHQKCVHVQYKESLFFFFSFFLLSIQKKYKFSWKANTRRQVLNCYLLLEKNYSFHAMWIFRCFLCVYDFFFIR